MLLIGFALAGLATAGAVTPGPLPPPVAGPPADSLAIVALERTWLHTGDTTVLAGILAPGFVHIAPGGYLLTRAQHLAYVATHPPEPGVRRRFERLDVRLFGHVAIANGVVATEFPGRETVRTVFTDVFVKRGSQWRAVNAQEDRVATERTNRHGR